VDSADQKAADTVMEAVDGIKTVSVLTLEPHIIDTFKRKLSSSYIT
jgi:hypothetical protein